MTHYPRIAQTFIAGEIDAVERAGVAVRCFAMNAPDAHELSAFGAKERSARTLYLKAALTEVIGAVASAFLHHPIGAFRVLMMAVGSAGGSLSRVGRRLAHFAQAALVARTARRESIDLLHAHFGLAPATIAWLASALASKSGSRRLPFTFTIHGFHDFVDPAEARLDLKARDAAAVVCISDFTRSQLFLTTDPQLWPRFHVIRCGVDLSKIDYRDPAPRDQSLRVLAVGRLSAEKGFALLIAAVGSLREQGLDVTLRLVGDGPLRSALETAADTPALRGAVTFTGELQPPDVREELKKADLFCLPSFSEGLPVSIMEAMASGVPVIATWISGIPELAENEVTALTVPPARPDALAHAIRRLATEPNLGPALATTARQRVEALHDQEANGRSMAMLFEEVSR